MRGILTEVDVAWLKANAVRTWEARNNIEGYELSNGRSVYVIAEGRLVNLAAGDGHPAEIMDMSFAVQAMSAAYLVKNKGQLTEKIIDVPREVDLEIASRKLAAWGIEIDHLTKEQEEYLNKGL